MSKSSDDQPIAISDAAPSDCFVKLTSSDDKEFLVPRNVCALSETLNNLLRDLNFDNQEETAQYAIPIPKVNSKILKTIIDWCEHYVNDKTRTTLDQDGRVIELSAWDAEFFNIDQTKVFEICHAADYLEIKVLLDVICKIIANMMTRKTPTQMREQFGLPPVAFTPEEEQLIREENAWCEN